MKKQSTQLLSCFISFSYLLCVLCETAARSASSSSLWITIELPSADSLTDDVVGTFTSATAAYLSLSASQVVVTSVSETSTTGTINFYLDVTSSTALERALLQSNMWAVQTALFSRGFTYRILRTSLLPNLPCSSAGQACAGQNKCNGTIVFPCTCPTTTTRAQIVVMQTAPFNPLNTTATSLLTGKYNVELQTYYSVINPGEPVRIEAVITSPTCEPVPSLKAGWVIMQGSKVLTDIWAQSNRTSVSADGLPHIIVQAGVLQEGVSYTFALAVQDTARYVGAASLTIIVNTAPSLGTFAIGDGVKVLDSPRMAACVGWSDGDGQSLSYRFFITSTQGKNISWGSINTCSPSGVMPPAKAAGVCVLDSNGMQTCSTRALTMPAKKYTLSDVLNCLLPGGEISDASAVLLAAYESLNTTERSTVVAQAMPFLHATGDAVLSGGFSTNGAATSFAMQLIDAMDSFLLFALPYQTQQLVITNIAKVIAISSLSIPELYVRRAANVLYQLRAANSSYTTAFTTLLPQMCCLAERRPPGTGPLAITLNTTTLTCQAIQYPLPKESVLTGPTTSVQLSSLTGTTFRTLCVSGVEWQDPLLPVVWSMPAFSGTTDGVTLPSNSVRNSVILQLRMNSGGSVMTSADLSKTPVVLRFAVQSQKLPSSPVQGQYVRQRNWCAWYNNATAGWEYPACQATTDGLSVSCTCYKIGYFAVYTTFELVPIPAGPRVRPPAFGDFSVAAVVYVALVLILALIAALVLRCRHARQTSNVGKREYAERQNPIVPAMFNPHRVPSGLLGVEAQLPAYRAESARPVREPDLFRSGLLEHHALLGVLFGSRNVKFSWYRQLPVLLAAVLIGPLVVAAWFFKGFNALILAQSVGVIASAAVASEAFFCVVRVCLSRHRVREASGAKELPFPSLTHMPAFVHLSADEVRYLALKEYERSSPFTSAIFLVLAEVIDAGPGYPPLRHHAQPLIEQLLAQLGSRDSPGLDLTWIRLAAFAVTQKAYAVAFCLLRYALRHVNPDLIVFPRQQLAAAARVLCRDLVLCIEQQTSNPAAAEEAANQAWAEMEAVDNTPLGRAVGARRAGVRFRDRGSARGNKKGGILKPAIYNTPVGAFDSDPETEEFQDGVPMADLMTLSLDDADRGTSALSSSDLLPQVEVKSGAFALDTDNDDDDFELDTETIEGEAFCITLEAPDTGRSRIKLNTARGTGETDVSVLFEAIDPGFFTNPDAMPDIEVSRDVEEIRRAVVGMAGATARHPYTAHTDSTRREYWAALTMLYGSQNGVSYSSLASLLAPVRPAVGQSINGTPSIPMPSLARVINSHTSCANAWFVRARDAYGSELATGSFLHPFRVVEEALPHLYPGDALVLLPGFHPPFTVANLHGTDESPIMIFGLDGTRVLGQGGPAVRLIDSSDIVVGNLAISDAAVGMLFDQWCHRIRLRSLTMERIITAYIPDATSLNGVQEYNVEYPERCKELCLPYSFRSLGWCMCLLGIVAGVIGILAMGVAFVTGEKYDQYVPRNWILHSSWALVVFLFLLEPLRVFLSLPLTRSDTA